MNITSNFEFSVIVPVYNEEENMTRLESTLSSYLPNSDLKTCIVFVDDGSTDTSLEKIKQICENHPDMFYVALSRNMGLSAALKAGIDAVESPYVGYIDADLQTDPNEFNLLIPYLNEYQLVTGIRADRKDTMVKKISSKLGNGYRRLLIGDDIKDTGCPLKILHTSYAKRLPLFTGMHRLLPALIALQEGEVKQLPITHYPRIAGKAKYHVLNRLVGPFVDCIVYRWMRSRNTFYHIQSTNL